AFVLLHPEGCGGPEDPSRQRRVGFNKWVRIVLHRRDPFWRNDLVFVFCDAAVIFRHEALSNVHFKLKSAITQENANDLAQVNRDDI
ncbi:unnamed protein product, partial [Laminaria digitata]